MRRVNQAVLPLLPAEAVPIGPIAGLVEGPEGGVMFVSGMVTFAFDVGDEVRRRLAAVQLVATNSWGAGKEAVRSRNPWYIAWSAHRSRSALVLPTAPNAENDQCGEQQQQPCLRLMTPFLPTRPMIWLRYAKAEDEACALIREAMTLSGDLQITGDTVHLRLDLASAPRRSRALASLCDQLTETKTIYPGTKLKIAYNIKGHSHTS
jgi:hypothetical protein